LNLILNEIFHYFTVADNLSTFSEFSMLYIMNGSTGFVSCLLLSIMQCKNKE